jgi:6,7-dimethyl-8-ribityllumazine synthase
MLTPVKRKAAKQAEGGRFVIIASKYNARYVEGMLRSARAVLTQAIAAEVHVVRVPGAFEIPVVAAKLASDNAGTISALICLGVILRGETTHAQHIGEAVSVALAQIQIQYHVPIIHEVLLLENEAQAKARCMSGEHNRGAEAAYTAFAMARTMRRLPRIAPSRLRTGPFHRTGGLTAA